MPKSTPNLLGVASPGLKIIYPNSGAGGTGTSGQVPGFNGSLSSLTDPNFLGTPYAGLWAESLFSNNNNDWGFDSLLLGGQAIGRTFWPSKTALEHQMSLIGGVPSCTLIGAKQLLEVVPGSAAYRYGVNDPQQLLLFPNVHGAHDCNFPQFYDFTGFGTVRSFVVTAAVPGRYILICSVATTGNATSYNTVDVKIDGGASIGGIDYLCSLTGVGNTRTFRAYVVNLTAGDHIITFTPIASQCVIAAAAHLLYDPLALGGVAYGADAFSFAATPIRSPNPAPPYDLQGWCQYGGFGTVAGFNQSMWEQFTTPNGTVGTTQQIVWAINNANQRYTTPIFGANVSAGASGGQAQYIDLVTDSSGHISSDGNDLCAAFWLPTPYISAL